MRDKKTKIKEEILVGKQKIAWIPEIKPEKEANEVYTDTQIDQVAFYLYFVLLVCFNVAFYVIFFLE